MKVHFTGVPCGAYSKNTTPVLAEVSCVRCRKSWEYRQALTEAGLVEPPALPTKDKTTTAEAVLGCLRLGEMSSTDLAEAVGVTSRRIRQVCNTNPHVERKNGATIKRLAVWGLCTD